MSEKNISLSEITSINYYHRSASSATTKLPMVFVHGFLDSWRVWEKMILTMPIDRDVFALTLRGWGDSSKNGPFTIDSYASDVVGFMNALGLQKVIFVGHSMGTLIGTAFAARNPDRCGGLVLCSGATTMNPELTLDLSVMDMGHQTVRCFFEAVLGGSPEVVFPANLDDDPDANKKGTSVFTESTKAGLCAFQDQEDSPESKTMSETFKASPRAIRGCWKDMFAEDHTAELGSITTGTQKISVLIVWANGDILFQNDEQDRLRAALSQPAFVVVPEADHDTCITNTFAAGVINAWVEDLGI